MKSFNRVILKITLILFLIGAILLVIGGLNGGFRNFSDIDADTPFGNFHYGFSSDKKEFSKDAEMSGEKAEFDAGEIENLDMEIGGAKVIIKESDSDKIVVEKSDNLKLSVEADGDTLRIETKNKKRVSNNELLAIYIPKGTVFEKIEYRLGEVEFESDVALVCEDMRIEAGAGSIKIGSCDVEKLNISVGAGDVAFSRCEVKDADIDVAMGEFKFDGDISGDLDLDMSMGSVSFTLDSEESAHNYEVKCAGGSVNVGGLEFAGAGASKKVDNDADSDFDIDCAMGSVDIIFADKM